MKLSYHSDVNLIFKLKEKENLRGIMANSRYLIWWYISDIKPGMTRMCETMVKMICHASLLKTDE